MDKTLNENIDYFRNRVTFEIPVFDTPEFQSILKELRRAQANEGDGFDTYADAKMHHYDD